MSTEERQRREDERRARYTRRQQLITQNTLPGDKKVKVRLENPNTYPVCVFWRFNIHSDPSHSYQWNMFSIVIPELGGITNLTFSRHHNLKVVPLEEINSDNPSNIDSMFEVCELNGPNFFDNTSQIDSSQYVDGIKYLYMIERKEYTPRLDPLTMWKNASLKSMFLLKELIRLGADKNDTYGMVLDLVQDIELPQFTELDKESAGVPSTFTNVT
tara:strand:+ start:94 stop:738 length:645 start_codon:yes stop_codon:yes gene_type:complete